MLVFVLLCSLISKWLTWRYLVLYIFLGWVCLYFCPYLKVNPLVLGRRLNSSISWSFHSFNRKPTVIPLTWRDSLWWTEVAVSALLISQLFQPSAALVVLPTQMCSLEPATGLRVHTQDLWLYTFWYFLPLFLTALTISDLFFEILKKQKTKSLMFDLSLNCLVCLWPLSAFRGKLYKRELYLG